MGESFEEVNLEALMPTVVDAYTQSLQWIQASGLNLENCIFITKLIFTALFFVSIIWGAATFLFS
jgi:hypothetical protein